VPQWRMAYSGAQWRTVAHFLNIRADGAESAGQTTSIGCVVTSRSCARKLHGYAITSVQRKENGESALNRYHASKQVERTKTCRTHLDIDGDASSAATRARIVLHSTNELITDVHHVHCGSFFVHVLSCMCFDSPLDEIGQKSLQAKELFQLVFQI